MIYYLLSAIVGCFLGIICYYIISNKQSLITRDQFKKSQQQIMSQLKEKKDIFDKELNEEQQRRRTELQEELNRLNQKFENNKELYQQNLNKLEEDYNKKRNDLLNMDLEAAAARLIDNQRKIEEEQLNLNTKLNQLSDKYAKEKEELEKGFFQFSEQINMKKAKLQNEIENYELRQKEIIARFKLDEERRQQSEFYKISLSQLDVNDIQKLKSLSSTFSRPEILLKLLYETYYKTKLEEMFKRVLGDNKEKGGIYKITNINNQKVYIGKTTNFISRWRTHAKRGCGIERIKGQLYDAMFEDGLENYMFEIVEICSKEEQSEKEKYWISFYNSDQYGYNIRKG